MSRGAISDWVHGRIPNYSRASGGKEHTCRRCGAAFPFPQLADYSYAHLLGLYLGDGLVSKPTSKEVFTLRVFLDARYPLIARECECAMSLAVPASKAGVFRFPSSPNMFVVQSCSKHWPCLFPQLGPGMKHTRPIVLDQWQKDIVDLYPWRFLRGLIQSDGWRGTNKIVHPKKTYFYPRYQFCNHSLDIQQLFCETCDAVGVEWRQMNQWNISVAKRDSVALMDRHIGLKR